MPAKPTPAPSVPASLPETGSVMDLSEPETTHRDWRNLKVDLVWVYEDAVMAEYRSGHTTSPDISAWLIEQGSLILRQDGSGDIHAQAGQWVVPSPEGRYQEFSKDAKILSVRVRCAWPDGLPLFPRGIDHPIPRDKYPGLLDATMSLARVVKPYPKSNFIHFTETRLKFTQFTELKQALWHWLENFYKLMLAEGALPSRVSIKDARVSRAVEILNALPLSSHFQEADIAAQVGLGVSQFVRLFRSETGVTPKRYFDSFRINYARRMVATETVTIKEVAMELGFLRLSDFCRWFKIHCQQSPRAYRQQALTLGGL